MNFDFDLFEDSFELYQSLTDKEKILFLYEMLYDLNELNESNEEDLENMEETVRMPLKDIIRHYDTSLLDIVKSSIQTDSATNVLILNSYIILNSQRQNSMKSTINDLLSSGLILQEKKLTKKEHDIFYQQKFCKVYHIIGQANPINYN
jgi:hypothetical protein